MTALDGFLLICNDGVKFGALAGVATRLEFLHGEDDRSQALA